MAIQFGAEPAEMALGDKTAQTIPQGLSADALTGGRSCSRAMQAQGWLHGSTLQLSTAPSSATSGTQAPAPTPCPTQPPHLEIGLAIKACCSDITGPIRAAGGQKYQVTGEGLICFHFYYVSNLGEGKYSHEKSSQLLLDCYNLASLKA